MIFCGLSDGVIDKYFEFNGPESLDSWVVTADSDNNGGFSTANVTISPSGFGCFSGNLCTRVPKTGDVRTAGYANIRYVPPLVRAPFSFLFLLDLRIITPSMQQSNLKQYFFAEIIFPRTYLCVGNVYTHGTPGTRGRSNLHGKHSPS